MPVFSDPDAESLGNATTGRGGAFAGATGRTSGALEDQPGSGAVVTTGDQTAVESASKRCDNAIAEYWADLADQQAADCCLEEFELSPFMPIGLDATYDKCLSNFTQATLAVARSQATMTQRCGDDVADGIAFASLALGFGECPGLAGLPG